jgi:hypothetical protein
MFDCQVIPVGQGGYDFAVTSSESAGPTAADPNARTRRYRCNACGNLTRFDVTATRRTRAFHHFDVSGELAIEETEILDEVIESVTCRWCQSSADTVEITAEEAAGASTPDSGRPSGETGSSM